LFVVDMQDSSQIADFSERFFFGLNAKVEFVPVMSAAFREGIIWRSEHDPALR